MHIKSTVPQKTVIEKKALPGTGKFVYGASDRFGGKVTFVAEEDHAIGESVMVPTKPDGPMTVEAFWKRSGQSIPITAISGMTACGRGGGHHGNSNIPSQAGRPPGGAGNGQTSRGRGKKNSRGLREYSVPPPCDFLSGVRARPRASKGRAPERSRDAALLTAGILAVCATGLYVLLA